MSDKLRFGLVGCGDFGVMLAPFIQEVGQLVAVCDPIAEHAHKTLKVLNLDLGAYTGPVGNPLLFCGDKRP